MTIALRAALYTRTLGVSYRTHAAQAALLRDFAERHGWTISGTYTDNGYTGRSLVRPALDQLREDARRHHYDLLVVLGPDYLATDPAHLALLLAEFGDLGMHVVYL